MSEAKAIAERLLIEAEGRTGYVVVLAGEIRALCEAVVGAAEVDAKLRDLVDARDGLSTLDEVRETINYYEHKMGNNYWPPQKEDEFKAQARRIADLEAQLEAVEKEKHENC